MEHYREKLKLQNLLLGILCCVLDAFCLLMALNGRLVSLPGSEPSGHWQSFWKGFCTGASSGVLVISGISSCPKSAGNGERCSAEKALRQRTR